MHRQVSSSQGCNIWKSINANPHIKDFYYENYRTLKKEIKEDLRRWKDLPYSWIDRISIVKMARLPKVLYRFKFPIKVPMMFFIEIEKAVIEIIWKN